MDLELIHSDEYIITKIKSIMTKLKPISIMIDHHQKSSMYNSFGNTYWFNL